MLTQIRKEQVAGFGGSGWVLVWEPKVCPVLVLLPI